MSPHNEKSHEHFKGKEALGHVAEVQAQGILSSAEIHGTEVPGHLSAACDTARDTAVALLLLWTLIISLDVALSKILTTLLIFCVGWCIWKAGRSAWIAWSRLERFHRILEQERWEIEHHRPQEREELKALYATKGFEGKLLDEVVDVLMADDNRLLHVMVEEELGLNLESYEHPLKQGAFAFIGAAIASVICLLGVYAHPFGMIVSALLTLAIASALSAYLAQNRSIPAIVWNLGLAILAFGTVYFLTRM